MNRIGDHYIGVLDGDWAGEGGKFESKSQQQRLYVGLAKRQRVASRTVCLGNYNRNLEKVVILHPLDIRNGEGIYVGLAKRHLLNLRSACPCENNPMFSW